jgi:flagellin-specific chaperone FliS
MQAMRRAIDAYGHASATLAPAQQIVLLYEGAIRRIKIL